MCNFDVHQLGLCLVSFHRNNNEKPTNSYLLLFMASHLDEAGKDFLYELITNAWKCQV